ncbi:hypothetical protein [Pleomorphomonas oryzae]|uniref:hypothetical protein n=1 Tax=Pleomorphomonas oryzae TaxID=261934 RepID=UPI00047C8D5F|nr:hypothetical protein [Pleomorphomonas oryzae]
MRLFVSEGVITRNESIYRILEEHEKYVEAHTDAQSTRKLKAGRVQSCAATRYAGLVIVREEWGRDVGPHISMFTAIEAGKPTISTCEFDFQYGIVGAEIAKCVFRKRN